MKNLKNLFAWITMAVVLTVGTIGANANTGVVIYGAPQCADQGGIMQDIAGIIIVGVPQIAGFIISDRPQTCVNGILISD